MIPTALICSKSSKREIINVSDPDKNIKEYLSVKANTQRLLEAVRGSFFIALSVLLPPLAEEQGLLVEEDVPLHGLEPSQILNLGVTFFVFGPHAEGPLHQQLTQLSQITLKKKKRHHNGTKNPKMFS